MKTRRVLLGTALALTALGGCAIVPTPIGPAVVPAPVVIRGGGHVHPGYGAYGGHAAPGHGGYGYGHGGPGYGGYGGPDRWGWGRGYGR